MIGFQQTYHYIPYIIVNIVRYVMYILPNDMIHKKINMYLIYNTTELCILLYDKFILQYAICILRYAIYYNKYSHLTVENIEVQYTYFSW